MIERSYTEKIRGFLWSIKKGQKIHMFTMYDANKIEHFYVFSDYLEIKML